ncbi:hypothetical protein [Aquimarina aquimarini]|uniref:hypothetical protein n=1 Tax=Aquimarina aquimarini TaxID=1191734 RepID=UPI000D5505B2|nr:hypothetical protein [Aquimarina aquimarini]
MENNFKPNISDKIKVEYHGELMQNMFSESTIDSSNGLQSIQYKDELAMLFFIDKKHTLRVIIQIDKSESGWSSYNLSTDNLEVSAFDIHHDDKSNSIKIAYASVNNDSSALLLSDEVKLSTIDPFKFKDVLKWDSININNVSRKIDHISMNQSGLLYSTSYLNDDATYSYFVYGNKPQDYTLPENTTKVKQLEVGCIYDDFGVFLLYDMKAERTMIFQSFPDSEFGEANLYRFRPSNVNVLDGFYTVNNADGNSHLYLSGDGIYKYTSPDDDKITICESGKGVVFSKIEVSINESETTIWAIGKANNKSGLYYITNNFYESADKVNKGKWTVPLQMQAAVSEFSSIKGNAFSNQLFLLGTEGNTNSLIHFWQDKVTTHWQEHPVVLQSLQELKTLETFTVNIQFKSDSSMCSFHGEKVRVSSEANLLVYIGSEKVAIGPNKSYETSIQDDYITIVYPTKSIASSLLYVEADFLSGKETIDPAHKLKKEIKTKFGDKQVLKNAKLPSGKHLISNTVSDSDLSAIVSATNKAYDHIDDLKNSSNSAEENKVQLQASNDAFLDIGNTFGDIWHSVKKGFIKITEFITEKISHGIKFIVKIGGKIFEWTSKLVSDVFHFLERIWEKIKVFFKDLFEYLAFLFNWNDIIHTKRVMEQYISNIILGLSDEMVNIKKKTYNYFDEVKDKLKKTREEIDFKSLNNQNLDQLRNVNTKDSKIDPRANWIGKKTNHIVKSDAQGKVANAIPDNVMAKATDISTKIIEHFKVLGNQAATVFTDLTEKFLALIHGNMKIGDFLEYMVLNLLELGVAVAQEIIDLIFELLIELIQSVDKILNAPINIPFFSYLYKNVSGEDTFSINDLICLLMAIPITAMYKIGEGEAPFKQKIEKTEFLNSGRTMFKLTI